MKLRSLTAHLLLCGRGKGEGAGGQWGSGTPALEHKLSLKGRGQDCVIGPRQGGGEGEELSSVQRRRVAHGSRSQFRAQRFCAHSPLPPS